jgi:hypothetical protein
MLAQTALLVQLEKTRWACRKTAILERPERMASLEQLEKTR